MYERWGERALSKGKRTTTSEDLWSADGRSDHLIATPSPILHSVPDVVYVFRVNLLLSSELAIAEVTQTRHSECIWMFSSHYRANNYCKDDKASPKGTF
jgi:hypothetical protein